MTPTSFAASNSTYPKLPSHNTSDDRFSLNTAYAYLEHTKRNADIHLLSPVQAVFKDAFKNYPTITSYIMVFAALSVIPVLSFVGFSVFATSMLIGIGVTFVFTWGSVIIGSALCMLLACLAFLLVAAFWILIGLFLVIFVFRLVYNIQSVLLHKVKDSQLVRELIQHVYEKRIQKDREDGKLQLAEKSRGAPNGQVS